MRFNLVSVLILQRKKNTKTLTKKEKNVLIRIKRSYKGLKEHNSNGL